MQIGYHRQGPVRQCMLTNESCFVYHSNICLYYLGYGFHSFVHRADEMPSCTICVGIVFCVTMHHPHCTKNKSVASWSSLPFTFLWGLVYRSIAEKHNLWIFSSSTLCKQLLAQYLNDLFFLMWCWLLDSLSLLFLPILHFYLYHSIRHAIYFHNMLI
jgi:hypothetical protein